MLVVVDDEPDLRVLLKAELTFEGYAVRLEPAADPHMFSPGYWKDVDVLLVDAMMPGTPGEDLVVYVKATVPQVRTVMLTASSAAALRSSADATLLKPYAIGELLEAIRG